MSIKIKVIFRFKDYSQTKRDCCNSPFVIVVLLLKTKGKLKHRFMIIFTAYNALQPETIHFLALLLCIFQTYQIPWICIGLSLAHSQPKPLHK